MLAHASPTSVAFAVGDRTRTVTLPTSDDAVIESPSVVTLTLSAGTGYTLGSPASADAEVSDNDAATFSVTATAAQIHEGRSASVTVAIANGTTFAEAQSIALSVSGSATAADYELSPSSLELAAEAAVASAVLMAVDDELEEEAETVTVTAALGGSEIGSVTVTIRASDAPPEQPDVAWGQRLPDRDIVLPGGSQPTGLWSDGDTIWVVSDWTNGRVLTYSLADGSALSDGEVALPDGVTSASSSFPLTGSRLAAGLWSDGETLWASDYFGDVRAYALADGARVEAEDFPNDVLSAAGNANPTGLWSDGDTIWVADHWQWKVFAYRLSDKARVTAREFDLVDDDTPYAGYGLWSDGETVLLVRAFSTRVLAHLLSSGAPRAELALDLAADGILSPSGLWSDGETLWVVNDGDNRIRAYAVPGLHRPAAGSEDPFELRVTSRAEPVPAGQPAGPPVFIPDAALHRAIVVVLRLEPEAPLNTRALAALRALDLRGAGVADLSGLEHAVNLTGLDLSGNPVSDLSPLQPLANLRVLGLGGVEAEPRSLSGLTGLTGLRRLSLRDNGLSEVWALSELAELQLLDLSGNPVADLRPLSGMHRLERLRLDDRELDLSPLDGLESLIEVELVTGRRNPRAGFPRMRKRGP